MHCQEVRRIRLGFGSRHVVCLVCMLYFYYVILSPLVALTRMTNMCLFKENLDGDLGAMSWNSDYREMFDV